jgi:alpha-beta hydrolase superfamily lysophospholipase
MFLRRYFDCKKMDVQYKMFGWSPKNDRKPMTSPQYECFTFSAADGHEIQLKVWSPAQAPTGVIQIFHGLGEYGARYARFASAATERNFVVGIHDHRGHGEHSDTPGFFAAENGWAALTSDALVVNEFLKQRFAKLPLTLMGHSMGSYVAQNFAMQHGERLDALLLSSSTFASRIETFAGNWLARLECWRLGEQGHSAVLDKLGFGHFNKPFAPARTELDWLSRDPVEVDAYIADPLCGGPFTAGLWRDLSRGLFKIASEVEINRVPSDLPILITGGEKDPVGGEHGMSRLAVHYARTSHGRLTMKIYPDGRHEMLNETNRDQVTADWLDWIDTNT